jgi:hypothetical protein
LAPTCSNASKSAMWFIRSIKTVSITHLVMTHKSSNLMNRLVYSRFNTLIINYQAWTATSIL